MKAPPGGEAGGVTSGGGAAGGGVSAGGVEAGGVAAGGVSAGGLDEVVGADGAAGLVLSSQPHRKSTLTMTKQKAGETSVLIGHPRAPGYLREV